MSATAVNLDLTDFELDIRMKHNGFWYQIIFRLAYTNKTYSEEAVAASPTQAYEYAMGYMSQVMRDAVPANGQKGR